jgi:hypothetical protein
MFLINQLDIIFSRMMESTRLILRTRTRGCLESKKMVGHKNTRDLEWFEPSKCNTLRQLDYLRVVLM